ncbi:hypothetical protein [Luteolibacter sp. Populi]|uniref:hypothetical protein n=1 Tax=Luteolibacter sp. Populi TaxID=3230487 RepID=UPI0034653209
MSPLRIMVLSAFVGAASLVHGDPQKAPKFKFKGESIHVLPVDLNKSAWGKTAPPGDPNVVPARYSNAFAAILTRAGAKGTPCDLSFKVSSMADETTISRELSEVVKKNADKASFTVFLSIESDKELKKIRLWLLNKEGEEVWKREETEFVKGRPVNPMSAMVFATGMLGVVSDLEDPTRRPPAPEKAVKTPKEADKAPDAPANDPQKAPEAEKAPATPPEKVESK